MPGAFVILQKRNSLANVGQDGTDSVKDGEIPQETWYDSLKLNCSGDQPLALLKKNPKGCSSAANCEAPLNLTKPKSSDEDSADGSFFETPPATPPRNGCHFVSSLGLLSQLLPWVSRSSEDLPLNLRRISTENHACPECGKRYSTSSNLARHRQTHRSPADRKARHCPHCGKLYVSMPAFAMHVRTHSQGCQCPHCGKRFSRPWLLQGHIRTHTGERPFKCPICAKAFADKSNLRAHIQTHSATKPYVCGRCGKAFALKSYLYKHEESSCMRLQRHDNRRLQSDAATNQS